VTVAPELRSSAVLRAGIPQAPIGVKAAPFGPLVGQVPAKSGHKAEAVGAFHAAQVGTEMTRT
jgi:hypothetical protein